MKECEWNKEEIFFQAIVLLLNFGCHARFIVHLSIVQCVAVYPEPVEGKHQTVLRSVILISNLTVSPEHGAGSII